MKLFLLTFTLFSFSLIKSQVSKKVLFIGNSYTSVNNLPQLTKDLSLSAGKNLIIDSHSPGGQTFQGHFGDATVNSKIALGNWDYVVLQEQSQRPSFPDSQVEIEVFPFAKKLDSLINLYNPCAETIFYMTWGRKNGDAGNCPFWPPVCTYSGMDSLLFLRYMQMTEENNASVSPVGKLWNYLRTNHPEIELYSSDESHPSLAGSYAAACSFFTTIFRQSPLDITNDCGLNPIDAANIRLAAKLIVFDQLNSWFIGTNDLAAQFTYSNVNTNTIQFTNSSVSATNFNWDFGDGSISIEENPVHAYTNGGTFNIQLIVSDNCGNIDTLIETISTNFNEINSMQNDKIELSPNPTSDFIQVKSTNQLEIELIDITGKKIMQFPLSNEITIDLTGFESGIYFLKIIFNGNKVELYKVLKN